MDCRSSPSLPSSSACMNVCSDCSNVNVRSHPLESINLRWPLNRVRWHMSLVSPRVHAWPLSIAHAHSGRPPHTVCVSDLASYLARFLTHSTGQGALKLILISDWLSLGCSSAIAPSVSCTPCRTLPFLSMCLQKRINQHQHRHQRHTLGSCDVNMHTSLRGECRWQSASRMTKMSPRRRLALGPSPPSL